MRDEEGVVVGAQGRHLLLQKERRGSIDLCDPSDVEDKKGRSG